MFSILITIWSCSFIGGSGNSPESRSFADKDVKAIFCARGGYGSIRLINKIDYDLIKNNPKIFCGYFLFNVFPLSSVMLPPIISVLEYSFDFLGLSLSIIIG